MKTAISLPDDTFEQVDRRAQQLGISRSEFFSTAARRYLDALDRSALTARINDALQLASEDEETTDAIAYNRSQLAADVDW